MNDLILKDDQLYSKCFAQFERRAFNWRLSIRGPHGGYHGIVRLDQDDLVELRDWVNEALKALGVE